MFLNPEDALFQTQRVCKYWPTRHQAHDSCAKISTVQRASSRDTYFWYKFKGRSKGMFL